MEKGQTNWGNAVKSYSRVGLVILTAVSILLVQSSAAIAASSGGSVFDNTRGGQAGILKRVVVSYLGLLAAYPDLRSSTHGEQERAIALTKMDMSISSMLFLFDPLNDLRSLKEFAALGSYYLGSHSAEIYGCLARRKGRALEPFLEQILHQSSTDCLDEFGEKANTKPGEVLICRTKEEENRGSRDLIEQINRGVGCSDQELLE